LHRRFRGDSRGETRSQSGVLRRFEKTNPSYGFTFNPEELKIELDEMVTQAGAPIYLHTQFCAPLIEDGVLTAVLVENKSGRGAIKAKVFIDASGDGDLMARLNLETYFSSHLQPATTCALLSGWSTLDTAGVAAFCALDNNVGISQLDAQRVRRVLAAGGSIVI
jgi:flavin-dependent dehydrogenase